MDKIPNMDDFRKVFLKYTRKALELLPIKENPRILDIGCGTGVVTIELARLTNGKIIGMDINKEVLEILQRKISLENFSKQISLKNSSLLSSGLEKESMDFIWAEGVIHIIGFEKSFKICNQLLKPSGFLVLAEALNEFDKNKKLITKYGFKLLNQINWEKGCWWINFYKPLEELLKKLRKEKVDQKLYEDLKKHEKEIKMVKRDIDASDCAHYILQKVR